MDHLLFKIDPTILLSFLRELNLSVVYSIFDLAFSFCFLLILLCRGIIRSLIGAIMPDPLKFLGGVFFSL